MGLPTRTINPGGRRGFTLLEGLAASVILALASLAIIGAVMASHTQNVSSEEDETAVQLARQLMEEIAAKPFVDPTDGNTAISATPKASRSLFVNIDDYHLYSDSTPNLGTLNLGSADVTARGTYKRDVTVQYRSGPAGPAVAGGGDFALVTVKVTPPQGQPHELSQLFARTPLTRYAP